MAEMLIDASGFQGMDPLNALGIEGLPDSDFLAFLGDIADPLDPFTAAVPVATTTAAPAEATAPKPPPLQFPAATVQTPWTGPQVTTGQLLNQPSLGRGSPCSSAASAEATNCPDSPMVSSPVTSSEAAHTAPASAATAVTAGTTAATRKRTRAQPQKATPAPSTVTQSTDQPQESQGTQSEQPPLTKAQLAAAKRRAPVVDWRAIDDPDERRKQRRLAKNRVTAARSRERKKEQMAEMEQRLSQLEAENGSLRALLQTMMSENNGLKEQLASLARGAAAAPHTHESGPKPAVLVKCLAIMHLVCCLLMCAKASLTLLPPLLSLVMEQKRCAGVSVDSCVAAASVCAVSAAASSYESFVGSCHCDGAAAQEWWRVRLRPALSLRA